MQQHSQCQTIGKELTTLREHQMVHTDEKQLNEMNETVYMQHYLTLEASQPAPLWFLLPTLL